MVYLLLIMWLCSQPTLSDTVLRQLAQSYEAVREDERPVKEAYG